MLLLDLELIHQYDKTASADSLAAASSELLSTVGVTVESKRFNPKQGPLLIVSNHPGSLDGHVLISTFKNDDFYIIGMASNELMGKTYVSHLLPVYGVRRMRDHISALLLENLGTQSLNSEEEARSKNRETISKASKLVSSGSSVIILPEGAGGGSTSDRSWKPGVGFLVKQITNPDTKIVFVKITGGSGFDFLRHAKLFIRRLLGKTNVTVEYSPLLSLFSMINQEDDGKTIAKMLEQIYKNQFS